MFLLALLSTFFLSSNALLAFLQQNSNAILSQINLTTGETMQIGRYNDYVLTPTCGISKDGSTIYTVADNYTTVSHPRTLLGVQAGNGELVVGNVDTDYTQPGVFDDDQVYLVALSNGYLYSYDASEDSWDSYWSWSGAYGSTAGFCYNRRHKQFWTLTSSQVGIYQYATKEYNTITNAYQIQSLAYDPMTDATYGFAPAAGNLLLYKIDQTFTWSLVAVVWGFQLQCQTQSTINYMTCVSAFGVGGELSFIGNNGFAQYLVTIDVQTGDVINKTPLSFQIASFCV